MYISEKITSKTISFMMFQSSFRKCVIRPLYITFVLTYMYVCWKMLVNIIIAKGKLRKITKTSANEWNESAKI